ncbi:ASKHA domain-containing protein [Clostridium sp. LBM24168]
MNLKIIQDENIYNIKCSSKKTIMENLIAGGVKISSPCGGRGTCLKCRIKLLEGIIREKNDSTGFGNNEYLACQTYCESDCTIKLSSIEGKEFSILKNFKSRKLQVNSEFRKIKIDLDENVFAKKSLVKYINLKLDLKLKFSLKALRKLSTLINESSINQNNYCLYGSRELYMLCLGDEVIDIFKTESEANVYGIAVDVGTTTIAMCIMDILSGSVLDSVSVLNSQRQFGADVLSRIQYSMENGMDIISMAVKDDILEGIEKLLASSGISCSNIYKVAISGNNVMQHLLMGLFCDSMSVYPFTSITNDIVEVNFHELFKKRLLNCKVNILPSMSSYIGADILSGMVSCNFYDSDKILMLVDIGTNGEMVIGNKNKSLCISTAAGPAFEGANIESGVGSINGAISSVKINKNLKKGENKYKINYDTIGNDPALGICGSGIIDVTAELLKNGIIDRSGKFDECSWKKNFINITQGIVFTQKDVREIQMAKSAIRSGIEILIKKFGCSYDEIYKVYIAGGFGSKISLKNAAVIGLLPEELTDKIELVGNSSLSGTVEYLINKNTKKNMEHIISTEETIDISMDDEFNTQFINNMSF